MSFGNKTALFTFCSFLVFLLFTPIAHGQNTSFRVTTMPQFPGPNENVTITVEDYSRDLNRTEITWTVNGQVIQKGTGVRRIETRTGALGSTLNVSINLGGFVHNMTVKPATIDLLWQSDTYTAPFYKGKALHSNEDPILITAEPFFINSQGVRLNPNDLVYRWRVDGKIVDPASGYGKKTFRHKPSILLKPIEITVEVASSDNTFTSSASTIITDTRPEVLMYENHPLYGILFDKALNDTRFTLTENEVSIIGLPYFFSREQMVNGLLSYDWRLNSSSVKKETDELVFRKPEKGSGSSSVALVMKNLERYMQTGEGALSIVFTDREAASANTIF